MSLISNPFIPVTSVRPIISLYNFYFLYNILFFIVTFILTVIISQVFFLVNCYIAGCIFSFDIINFLKIELLKQSNIDKL
ncbi:MAG: hypothetical protein EXX96DRAFT_566235 [Benjaminiella poitrasii]|nr:MAG: hypothetical protein EXX96DRAFT_566235 [Benjaminiella poitrasii]